jgi:transcriptional regulator with XRE-family HTH domain
MTASEDRSQYGGDELRRRITRLNLTQQEVAEEIGVTVRTVQAYLRGEYLPGPKIRRRLDRLYAELERNEE